MLSFLRVLFSGLFMFAAPGLASAQDGTMRACGEKWQAAKAAGTTNGATWPKFLAECRAAMGRGASAATQATPAPAKTAPEPKPAQSDAAAAAPARRGSPVFPASVSPKFAELRPAQARQKTCSEQYQANKATDANGGLRWLEKGGGYWSLCNKKLKGL